MPVNPDTQALISALAAQTAAIVQALDQQTAALNANLTQLSQQLNLLPRTDNRSGPHPWPR